MWRGVRASLGAGRRRGTRIVFCCWCPPRSVADGKQGVWRLAFGAAGSSGFWLLGAGGWGGGAWLVPGQCSGAPKGAARHAALGNGAHGFGRLHGPQPPPSTHTHTPMTRTRTRTPTPQHTPALRRLCMPPRTDGGRPGCDRQDSGRGWCVGGGRRLRPRGRPCILPWLINAEGSPPAEVPIPCLQQRDGQPPVVCHAHLHVPTTAVPCRAGQGRAGQAEGAGSGAGVGGCGQGHGTTKPSVHPVDAPKALSSASQSTDLRRPRAPCAARTALAPPSPLPFARPARPPPGAVLCPPPPALPRPSAARTRLFAS